MPGVLMVARKGKRQRSALIDEIQEAVARRVALGSGFIVRRVANSAKEKSIVTCAAESGDVIVKVPHSHVARVAEERNFDLLLKAEMSPRLKKIIPSPILKSTAMGRTFFVEQKILGEPLAERLSAPARRIYAPQASEILRSLNPSLHGAQPHPLSGLLYQRLVDPYLSSVLEFLDDGERARVADVFRESLDGATTRLGTVHGDFSANNIFVRHGRICGVIDWEDVAYDAPPIIDAFNYLDSVERVSNAATLEVTIPALAEGDWPVEQELELLKGFFCFNGSDWKHRRGFALLYWLYHVGPQLSFDDTLDPDVARAKIERVLKRF